MYNTADFLFLKMFMYSLGLLIKKTSQPTNINFDKILNIWFGPGIFKDIFSMAFKNILR